MSVRTIIRACDPKPGNQTRGCGRRSGLFRRRKKDRDATPGGHTSGAASAVTGAIDRSNDGVQCICPWRVQIGHGDGPASFRKNHAPAKPSELIQSEVIAF
jgi:hypothetical protein